MCALDQVPLSDILVTTKDFDKSLKIAFLGGGQRQKIAIKVRSIIGGLAEPNPFTGHGLRSIRDLSTYNRYVSSSSGILLVKSYARFCAAAPTCWSIVAEGLDGPAR
jgi:hypothetical protein